MLLCFSPCPNDTFIFHALLHNRVDAGGLNLDVQIADISVLNRLAIEGRGDAVKISFAAYPLMRRQYWLLDAGSALGCGGGPLFVARQPLPVIDASTIVAIPGVHTTAALLMRRAFPQVRRYVPMLFSEIPKFVSNGGADAGALIHESRFTYAQQGLHLIADLGEWWERRFGMPVPLGGIALKRTLPLEEQRAFVRALRQSIDYALRHPAESRPFIKKYAAELSDEVIDKHIGMFVNRYTRSLGGAGRKAVRTLLAADGGSG